MNELNSTRYLVIEGNIGAGKTTLSTKIAEQMNARLVLEQFADNPFLPKFYADPKRYSFTLELSFLAERYQQLSRELGNQSLFQEMVIADYYFMKSLIFANNTLEKDEFKLYKKLFNIIYPSLPKPDLYVYLHLPVEKLKENIKKRGREYEQQISPDYLLTVQQGYFEYFKQHQRDFSFVVIDTSNVDFVEREEDYRKLTALIFEEKYPKGITRIIV